MAVFLAVYKVFENHIPSKRGKAMPLTAVQVKNAKGREKQYKLQDADGLYLLVIPAGGKYWRFDYRHDSKRKTLALGTYPEISLLEARSSLIEARKAKAKGIDPAQQKKAKKQAQTTTENSFEVVAREWHGKQKSRWTADYSDKVMSSLKRDVFPWLGKKPIIEITAPDVLRVLRRVESRGAIETAHRVKTECGQVFRYGVYTGRCDRDPSADLRGALTPIQKSHGRYY